MRSLLLAPAMLSGFAAISAEAPVPIAQRDAGVSRLAADSETQWIAFDLTPGNQIRFAMTVDGRVVTAILDTGVSYSVLARRRVDSARLRSLPQGSAAAIGGAIDIGWIPTRAIRLGGLTRSGGGLVVADLPALATDTAEPVDLLVGRDLTAGFAIDIDYAARRFRLLRSGRMPFRGMSAPLTIARDRLIYVGELSLGAGLLRPIVIDTGDGAAVTVSAASWRTAALPPMPTTTGISFGLAGAAVTTLGIVPEIGVGQLVARHVEVRIEPAGGFSETIGMAGRIGSGFLQNYRVLLDPGAGHMVLSPGPQANRAQLRSTSGLLVGAEGNRLRVRHVMLGGPADVAGWRSGDMICTIDGQPVPADYPADPIASWSADTPGRIVSLGLCDGSIRQLTLRQFY